MFKAQNCLLNSNGSQIPFFPVSQQAVNLAIVTSYKFQCCGNITEWRAYRRFTEDPNTVHFQVWRPSPLREGCFNLVGEDTYTGVGDRFKDRIRRFTVPSNNITIQPGDVVGYFVNSMVDESIRAIDGVALDITSTTESVWYYGSSTDSEELPFRIRSDSCQASIGPNGTLRSFTAAAPILSIAIGT